MDVVKFLHKLIQTALAVVFLAGYATPTATPSPSATFPPSPQTPAQPAPPPVQPSLFKLLQSVDVSPSDSFAGGMFVHSADVQVSRPIY